MNSGKQAQLAVIGYIVEEVSRQGHDVKALDGIERVGWMVNAWGCALRFEYRRPEVADAILLGRKIEPGRNEDGLRLIGVRVGWTVCPSPEKVPILLERLWEKRDELPPLDFYKEFELIHPFVDGNGRTGKVLLNWLAGKLLDPFFPPADLFGHPIRNP